VISYVLLTNPTKGQFMPTITGFHHVVLSVSDLDASVRWYCELLGFSEFFPWNTDDFQRRLLIHPSGAILGLTEHNGAFANDEFSERRPGLDHLSFGVATFEELQAWEVRLNAAGIENSGVTVTPTTGFTLIAFRDPDRIQLELYLADG
jgi:glyoxylase I family protein